MIFKLIEYLHSCDKSYLIIIYYSFKKKYMYIAIFELLIHYNGHVYLCLGGILVGYRFIYLEFGFGNVVLIQFNSIQFKAKIFLVSTIVSVFHKLWYTMFLLSLILKYFLLSCVISSLTNRLFRIIWLIFKYLVLS